MNSCPTILDGHVTYIHWPGKKFVALWLLGGDAFSAHSASSNFPRTFVEHASQLSCWTLFRRSAFTNRFRECLPRVFWIFALPLLPLDDCTSLCFFTLNNCSLHSPKFYGWYLRRFSGRFPSPVETYDLSFVKDGGSFCRLFPSVIIHSCCRGEQLQYWLPVRLNATIVTIILFFKIVMRRPVNDCLHHIHNLPGCDKLCARVVYIQYICVYIYIYIVHYFNQWLLLTLPQRTLRHYTSF